MAGSSVASGQRLALSAAAPSSLDQPDRSGCGGGSRISVRKNGKVKLWVKRGGMAILPGRGCWRSRRAAQ
jgi:hypothetical protein